MAPKRILLSPLFTCLCLTATATATAADGVEWLRSAAKAAELSQKTGKPILIYVRSETCHYCDLMQRDVWEDPATVAMIQRQFIPLKLTREENKEGVEAMKVKGYPRP
jgi:thioredoxin-related protein